MLFSWKWLPNIILCVRLWVGFLNTSHTIYKLQCVIFAEMWPTVVLWVDLRALKALLCFVVASSAPQVGESSLKASYRVSRANQHGVTWSHATGYVVTCCVWVNNTHSKSTLAYWRHTHTYIVYIYIYIYIIRLLEKKTKNGKEWWGASIY